MNERKALGCISLEFYSVQKTGVLVGMFKAISFKESGDIYHWKIVSIGIVVQGQRNWDIVL